MAKCFDLVGYAEPCNAERRKPTGRALLFSAIGGESAILEDLITFSDNGLRITQISETSDWDVAISEYKGAGGSAFPISIYAQNPLSITIQGNTDSGRVLYHKTVHCSLFDDHSGKAEEFIQGMLYSKNAGILVIEREGTSYTDVFGAYGGVHIDPSSVTRSEYENGGAWEFDIYCDEPIPNVGSYMNKIGIAIDTLNA